MKYDELAYETEPNSIFPLNHKPESSVPMYMPPDPQKTTFNGTLKFCVKGETNPENRTFVVTVEINGKHTLKDTNWLNNLEYKGWSKSKKIIDWAREHIQNYDMFLFAMKTEDKEGIECIARYSREKNRTAYFKMKHGKAYFCAPKIYGDEYCASMGPAPGGILSGFVFVQRNIDKKLKSPIIAEMPNFPANDFGYEQAAINAEKERSGKKRKASKQKEKKDAKKVRFNPEAKPQTEIVPRKRPSEGGGHSPKKKKRKLTSDEWKIIEVVRSIIPTGPGGDKKLKLALRNCQKDKQDLAVRLEEQTKAQETLEKELSEVKKKLAEKELMCEELDEAKKKLKEKDGLETELLEVKKESEARMQEIKNEQIANESMQSELQKVQKKLEDAHKRLEDQDLEVINLKKLLENAKTDAKQATKDLSSSQDELEKFKSLDKSILQSLKTEKQNEVLKILEETLSEKKMCTVCSANPKDIVLVPCLHMICQGCSESLNECPQCKTPIGGRKSMYS